MTIALVGRRDEPTDAVEDYCRFLGNALKERAAGFAFERVAWNQRGWLASLAQLWQLGARSKGHWALVQYTALMWSRRGFPLAFPLVIGMLKARGVRVAVVFHDQGPYGGKRLVDRIRRVCQSEVMDWSYRLSDVSVLTFPRDNAGWLPSPANKAAYVPIGANVPVVIGAPRNSDEARTITVFGVTDGGDISKEVSDIARAAICAARRLPRVRLVTIGRGSRESERKFRQALEGSSVDFCARGILPADQVARELANSDVSLYVRSPITTQRGSAIASVVNGVPLVAYADSILPAPLAEAGVVSVPYLDGEKLAEATAHVLTDGELWNDLHQRSRRAYEKYFSWEAVAGRFQEVLNLG